MAPTATESAASLGRRIVELWNRRGWNQKELAARPGASDAHLGREMLCYAFPAQRSMPATLD